MKSTKFTILTATLAAVAFSAVIQKRANPLPARFGLVIVSDSPNSNGYRARYSRGDLITFIPSGPTDPVEIKDLVLRGDAGHVILDITVHPGIPGYWDTSLGGNWELIRFNYWTFLTIYSVDRLGLYYGATTGGFVEYDSFLRPTGPNGEVLESKWVACGTVVYSEDPNEQSDLGIEWDPFNNTVCPHIEFKIVEL